MLPLFPMASLLPYPILGNWRNISGVTALLIANDYGHYCPRCSSCTFEPHGDMPGCPEQILVILAL